MAVKKKKANRGRTKAPAPQNTAIKALPISIDSARYTGYETEWTSVTFKDAAARKVAMIKAFNWYSYNFSSKDAKALMLEYLKINKRADEFKSFKKVKDGAFANGQAWLARMTLMGWPINKVEQQKLDEAITAAIAAAVNNVPETAATDEAPAVNKPNIQERMREKAHETTGEIIGLLDDYIADGAKARHNFSPIAVLKTANILPAHVNDEIVYWTPVLKEFQEAYKGGDKDLKEAYSHFSKIQLRNIVKFIETILADYLSYVAFKKAAKAPRKRKPKTPEQIVRKLKYLRELPELSLTSIKPEKIVEAKEVFAYDSKKRKLIYFIADEYAGGLTVKNNTIVGFDVTKSSQKTVRKPAEQLKEFMAASRPNTRKMYTNTKAVEVKHSGRFNENIVILKVF